MSDNTQTDYHYFGSTAFGWTVGATRAEVLKRLGRMAGAARVKDNVRRHGGLYAWTVRVLAPIDYDVRDCARRVVPGTEAAAEFRIQDTRGRALPLDGEVA